MLCSENFMRRKDLNTSKGKKPGQWLFRSWNFWPRRLESCGHGKFIAKADWESEVSPKQKEFLGPNIKKSTTLKGREISERSSFQDCVLNCDARNKISSPHTRRRPFLISRIVSSRSIIISASAENRKKVKISESWRLKSASKMQVKFLFMFFTASCVCLLLSWWMKKNVEPVLCVRVRGKL